jgi:predicted phosphodiesterase
VKLLHLSDVHFGIWDETAEQGRILDGLRKYLVANNVKVDFIIFTGDLSQRASETELTAGFDWLSGLAEITDGKILLVPGNHDVHRGSAEIDELRLASPTESSFNRQKRKIYRSHDHLRPFLECFQQCERREFLNTWENNPFMDCVRLVFEGRSIIFSCLNTAILSCGDDDEGNLCVDLASLNSCLNGSDAESTLIIAIGHHPVSWLADWNGQKLSAVLQQETGPHLYLHGHMHERSGKSAFATTGAGIASFAAGATYQGAEWEQSFWIIDVEYAKSRVNCRLIEYSNEAGTWDSNPKLSKAVPVRLPVVLDQTGLIEEVPLDRGSVALPYDNPFDSVAANDIDPNIIPKLFVDKNNFLNRITNRFDAIVEGQRGTGKTMLLRYLSIDAQNEASKSTRDEGALSRLEYFGIYCRVSTKGFARTDIQAVPDRDRRDALFGERLAYFLIARTVESLSIVIGRDTKIGQSLAPIMAKLRTLLCIENSNVIDCWDTLCTTALELCDDHIESIDNHVASLLPGASPTTYNTRLSVSTSFYSFLSTVKKALGLACPFFLLVDDFDSLNAEQQEYIFRCAAERNHALICYKFGIMTFGRRTGLAGRGRTYREGDDYDLIELIWLDKGLEGTRGEGNYKKTVIEIANRRLESSNWPTNTSFSSLFEDWRRGSELRDIVKAEMRAAYESMPVEDRPSRFQSFYDKQKVSYYFRHLRKNKIEHRYAGQNTIVDISSGIFRQFLEICSHIVSKAFDAGWSPERGNKIGVEIQNDAIKSYSNDMIKSMGETAGDTSSLSHNQHEVSGRHIVNLAESLSALFYHRLHSDVRDGEVIAIAIRGEIDDESFGKTILDIAVRESVLHRRKQDYPSKTPTGAKFPTYVLNRRLVPRKGLGVKLQGRCELSIDDVELAAKDPEAFLRKAVSGSPIERGQGKLDLFGESTNESG